ncbi:hypothetical protein QBC39DRAFT_370152 [Podospora conica]|nr:hypothetical protein QBC39DRAFT_370152 [Schizothecium conicum]
MSSSANNNGNGDGNGAGDNGENNNNGAAGTKVQINFKTYEGQSRLLAALVASLLEKNNGRLDYKELSKYMGGKTANAIEKFLRPIKAQGNVTRELVRKGVVEIPFEEFSGVMNQVDADAYIHKFFGASTPGGIEFQFREVRQTAQEMRDSVATTGATTPATKAATKPRATPRKRAPATSSKPAPAPAARKRARQTMMDEDDDEYVDKKKRTRSAGSSSSRTAASTPAAAPTTFGVAPIPGDFRLGRPVSQHSSDAAPAPVRGAEALYAQPSRRWSITPAEIARELDAEDRRRQQEELSSYHPVAPAVSTGVIDHRLLGGGAGVQGQYQQQGLGGATHGEGGGGYSGGMGQGYGGRYQAGVRMSNEEEEDDEGEI